MDRLYLSENTFIAWNVIDYGFSERAIMKLFEWSKDEKINSCNFKLEENYKYIPTIIINSVGGSISDAWAVIDVMNNMPYPIRTVALGEVASGGLTVFLAGTKGMRTSGEHTIFMLHHYRWGNSTGNYNDMRNRRVMEDSIHDDLLLYYASKTNFERIYLEEKLSFKGDFFFNTKSAVEYGVVDRII